MRYSEKNIDMLTGSLYRSILFFTIPIALSSMLQQLFNAADTAIVGLFDTSSSLAAVGAERRNYCPDRGSVIRIICRSQCIGCSADRAALPMQKNSADMSGLLYCEQSDPY